MGAGMTEPVDPANLIDLAAYKAEREEYIRRTERHKRRLQKAEDEAIGLPAFPGGIGEE
jgi:hypothetical protein